MIDNNPGGDGAEVHPGMRHGDTRTSRSIRFSDREWEQVSQAAARHDMNSPAEFVRNAAMTMARNEALMTRGALSPGLVQLIEHTFRGVPLSFDDQARRIDSSGAQGRGRKRGPGGQGGSDGTAFFRLSCQSGLNDLHSARVTSVSVRRSERFDDHHSDRRTPGRDRKLRAPRLGRRTDLHLPHLPPLAGGLVA